MTRQKTTKEQLEKLITLPVNPPRGVHGRIVENWQQRVDVASYFFKHYETVTKDIEVTSHETAKPPLKKGWIYENTTKPQTSIKRLGEVDGAVKAHQLGIDAMQKPIMVIAANHEHIGGSLYRVAEGKTGDAQEEQAGNTYAGALALASHPGVSKGVEKGNICYTDQYDDLLRGRGAIEVSNVPGDKGQVCDQLLVAAPDLKNKKECFFKDTGEFDYQSYQNQIYTMYSNVFSAIVSKDPNQPIILTLPGAGVFLGEDEDVKKQAIIIQGLCLRRVLQENAAQLKDRKLYLPHAESEVNAQIMKIVDADPAELTQKIDELKSLQMAQKSKMFADIRDLLDDIEAEAKEFGTTADGIHIQKNINQIREQLLLAYPALMGETKNIKLDDLEEKIVGLVKDIQPTAARHGGLRQDLMFLLAAIMDVFTLGLTAWLVDNSALEAGMSKNLGSIKEKFTLFKGELSQIKTEADAPEKGEVHDDKPSNQLN